MRGAGLRSRWPRWPVALAVIGVIIVGGAAAVAKWPHAWWWLVVVMAVAAAVTPPAVAALSQASQRRQEVERTARAGLQGTIGSKLPAAGAADLEARVHQTVLPIPYIHRDEEETIRAHLGAGRPVLLIGSSMVGKTKMAARVIAKEFGSWPVAIPDSKTALADLDAQDVTLQGTVIWLDDIDRLIGAGGITDGALRRLAAAGNIIVATIRAKEYEKFLPSDQGRPSEWDVLGVFERIVISRDLTGDEQERLASEVKNPAIREQIRAVGIGEYVGGARYVAERLNLGATGTNSIGYALVLGAADWRLCGMTRPVPASVLRSLAEPHLDWRGQARLADESAYNQGLAWATQDINPNVSLLQPAGADSYDVYDYALDLISQPEIPIPDDSSWNVIITQADGPELIDLGFEARYIYERAGPAMHAYRKAASDPRYAWNAIYEMAELYSAAGEVSSAKAVLLQGFELKGDDSHYRVIAKDILQHILVKLGDVDGAKAAWQQVIDSTHPDQAPEAIYVLGELLQELDDVDGAKAAWQQVIDSGHPEAAWKAAIGLMELLSELGDEDGAEAAWQQAGKFWPPELR